MVAPKHGQEEFSQAQIDLAGRVFAQIVDLEQRLQRGEGITYDAISDLRAEYERVTPTLKFPLELAQMDLKLHAMEQAVKTRDFRRAYEEFVGLIQPITAVRYVAGMNGESPDIFAFIEHRDEAVCSLIYEQEDTLVRRFPRVNVDFHIVYLQGRPLNQFLDPVPNLFYAREEGKALQGGTPSPGWPQ